MKYLVSLLVIIISFTVLGMKTNTLERWDPGEFSYEDSVFYAGQTKTLYIVYDYNRGGDIDPSSVFLADSIVAFMNENKHLTIEISNHTDCRGNDNYNIQLSTKRAMAVMNYLISKGIDSKRLTSFGAGERKYLYSEEYITQNGKTTEEKELMHQKNRRTVLKITSVNYEKK